MKQVLILILQKRRVNDLVQAERIMDFKDFVTDGDYEEILKKIYFITSPNATEEGYSIFEESLEAVDIIDYLKSAPCRVIQALSKVAGNGAF